MHDLHTTWLKVFREVARRGSLSAAAWRRWATPSPRCRGRSRRSRARWAYGCSTGCPAAYAFTEEGRCLLPHAEAVLERLDTAAEDLAALGALETGRLRVGAFDSADTALVPRALAAFRAEHPRVALSLVEGNSRGQVEQLLNGRTDVSLVSGRSHPALKLRHLMDDPMLVALPAGHRLAASPVLRLAELAFPNVRSKDSPARSPLFPRPAVGWDIGPKSISARGNRLSRDSCRPVWASRSYHRLSRPRSRPALRCARCIRTTFPLG